MEAGHSPQQNRFASCRQRKRNVPVRRQTRRGWFASHRHDVTERGPLSGGFGFESVAPDPFDVIAVGLKFVVHVSKG